MASDFNSKLIRLTDDPVSSSFRGAGATSARSFAFGRIFINMIAEAGEDFLRYLKNLGMSEENNLMVLSSKDFYNYNNGELDEVRTLVSRKKLNLIKHLDVFLFTVARVLPGNARFIGCYSDSKIPQKSTFNYYKPQRLFNLILNFLDSSSKNKLNRKGVFEIFNKNGLTIVDVTEMNGLTYFCSHKSGIDLNLVFTD